MIEQDVQLLRDQVARLISRNLELEEKIEVLQRERTEIGVAELARSLIEATREAERVMDDASDGGLGYAIPRAELSVHGLLGRRGDAVALRFPGPEDRVAGATLSTVSMVVAHVPSETRASAGSRFKEALERAQAAALTHPTGPGSQAATAIAGHATHLLALPRPWSGAEVVAGVRHLAEAFEGFGRTGARALPSAERERYLACSRSLVDVAARLETAGRPSDRDIADAAVVIHELGDVLSA
jgi:hypothetical protein